MEVIFIPKNIDDYSSQFKYKNVIRALTDNIFLDSIYNLLKKIFNISKAKNNHRCVVRFVDNDEMRNHEEKNVKINTVEIRKLLSKLEKLPYLDATNELSFTIKSIDRKVNNLLEELKTFDIEESTVITRTIQDLQSTIIKVFKEMENYSEIDSFDLGELFYIIYDLRKELNMISFPRKLWGCYIRNTEILICLENIFDSANKEHPGDSEFFINLTKSVLVHEFTHYIDGLLRKQKHLVPKDETSILQKSAVNETIAETVQMIFIEDVINEENLVNFIHKHSESMNFPGWGYGGAAILENIRGYDKKYLLNKLIYTAQQSWSDAYMLMQSLQILQFEDELFNWK